MSDRNEYLIGYVIGLAILLPYLITHPMMRSCGQGGMDPIWVFTLLLGIPCTGLALVCVGDLICELRARKKRKKFIKRTTASFPTWDDIK